MQIEVCKSIRNMHRNPNLCLFSLTSYARLSASLATVSPASSPSPSSLSMASSAPMMNDFPEVGGKVIASTADKESWRREQFLLSPLVELKEWSVTFFLCLIFSFTFFGSVGFVLVEADRVGPGLRLGRRLHVRQILCVSEVGQHVLQLGPVRPCSRSQVVTKTDKQSQKHERNQTV